MLSSQSVLARAPKDLPFELMLEAIREKNEEKFEEALKSASPNIYSKKYRDTPIGVFAAKKDTSSVDFSLDRGGRFDWAIQNFALHGHKAEAYEYLKKGIEKYPDRALLMICKLMEGFILGGFLKDADELLQLVEQEGYSEEDISKVVEASIPGLFVNEEEKIGYELLARVSKEKLPLLLRKIGETLAIRGSQESVNKFLAGAKNHYSPRKFFCVQTGVAAGFAMIGSLDKAFEIYQQVVEVEEEFYNSHRYANGVLSAMAGGLGMAGDMEEIQMFLEKIRERAPSRFLELQAVVMGGLAVGGHKKTVFERLEEVKKQFSPNRVPLFILHGIAVGFLKWGCDSDAEQSYQLLKMMREDRYPSKEIFYILTEMMKTFLQSRRQKDLNMLLEYVQKEHADHFIPLLEMIANLPREEDKCLDKASVLKHLTMIEDANKREELLRKLLATKDYGVTEGFLLRLETIVDGSDRDQLLLEFREAKQKEIASILLEIATWRVLMQEHHLTYAQARGWDAQDVRDFLLSAGEEKQSPQCNDFFQGLVTEFLTPVEITPREVGGLSNKLARFFKSAETPQVEEKQAPKRKREELPSSEGRGVAQRSMGSASQ